MRLYAWDSSKSWMLKLCDYARERFHPIRTFPPSELFTWRGESQVLLESSSSSSLFNSQCKTRRMMEFCCLASRSGQLMAHFSPLRGWKPSKWDVCRLSFACASSRISQSLVISLKREIILQLYLKRGKSKVIRRSTYGKIFRVLEWPRVT